MCGPLRSRPFGDVTASQSAVHVADDASPPNEAKQCVSSVPASDPYMDVLKPARRVRARATGVSREVEGFNPDLHIIIIGRSNWRAIPLPKMVPLNGHDSIKR